MGVQQELQTKPFSVALRTTEFTLPEACVKQGEIWLWIFFLSFRDISWPSQVPHPNPANFLVRTIACEGGLWIVGLLTTWAGAVSSGRKRRGSPDMSTGRKELNET